MEEVLKVDKNIDRVMKELQDVKTLIHNHSTNVREQIDEWKSNLVSVRREKERIRSFEAKLDDCGNLPSAGVLMGEVELALEATREKFSEFKRLLQKNERQRHDLEEVSLSVCSTVCLSTFLLA